MDAFLRYLSTKDRLKGRLFISESPGLVMLVWADFTQLPKLSGITFVHQNTVRIERDAYAHLIDVLRRKNSSLPIHDIVYQTDLAIFIIDGVEYTNEQAALFLSESLHLAIGEKVAKKPNNPEQVLDPFHVWSRLVFDGVNVRKVDLDAIILTEDRNDIKSIIEIKRSRKVGIGKWKPYVDREAVRSDYWNYIMCLSLAKILGADFLTFHHEIMEADIEFDDNSIVELFEFKKNTLISVETINYFASDANRARYSGAQFG